MSSMTGMRWIITKKRAAISCQLSVVGCRPFTWNLHVRNRSEIAAGYGETMLLHATAPPDALRTRTGEPRVAPADVRSAGAEPRAPKIAVASMNFYYGFHRVLHNITL